jgi:hypothetical protein
MKHFNFKSLLFLSLTMILMIIVSCTKEDDDPGPIDLLPKLDGLYVYGTNTVSTDPGTPASRVNLAILDPGKGAQEENLPGYYGKFIHIGANSTIQLAYVENEVGKVYGAEGGGSQDSAIVVGGSINDLVINGPLVEDGPAINVTNEGLYYLWVDINTESFILMEVKANIIGDATELQWSAGTPLPLKSSDTTATVFEATNIPLVGASGYRYRFNDGWHVFEGTTAVTLSSLGVPDYGVAWDTGVNDIGFYLDNAPQKETGMFTITLSYDAKTETWSEIKTKTGDLLVDYSDSEFGWFGNAYYVEGSTEGAWDAIHHIKKPEKDGNLYNWTWNMELIEGRSFVLRENGGTNAWITWGGAAKFGTAFDEGMIIKEDGQDNYFVATGGEYTVTFTINAEDDGRILTIEPNS